LKVSPLRINFKLIEGRFEFGVCLHAKNGLEGLPRTERNELIFGLLILHYIHPSTIPSRLFIDHCAIRAIFSRILLITRFHLLKLTVNNLPYSTIDFTNVPMTVVLIIFLAWMSHGLDLLIVRSFFQWLHFPIALYNILICDGTVSTVMVVATLVHPPELCLAREEFKNEITRWIDGMNDVAKKAGVKVHGAYSCPSEHTFYFVLESDDYKT
jgi:hypothetical protein